MNYEVVTGDGRMRQITAEQLPYFLLELFYDNAVEAIVARGLLEQGKVVKHRGFEVKQLVKEKKNVSR